MVNRSVWIERARRGPRRLCDRSRTVPAPRPPTGASPAVRVDA